MKRVYAIIYALFAMISLCSCERVDRESITRLADIDPTFRAVLEKKRDIDSRITSYETQLRDLRKTTEGNIRTLQRSFNKQKKDIESKISSLKKELRPEIENLQKQLEVKKELLRIKKRGLRDLTKMRRGVERLVTQGRSSSATQGEIKGWEERRQSLDDQIGPLKGDIEELKEQIGLLKAKLIVLK